MKAYTPPENNYINFTQRLLLTLCFLVASHFAMAQEDDTDQTQSPYFSVSSDGSQTASLPLKSTTASVNITGVIADVTIQQRYINEGKTKLEAVYVFPTSTNAAIYAMEMKVGDRIITAKIEERNKARSSYETAKSEGKRTSLLEQHRPNVFQMNVANILPGDEIEVSLSYTELLVPEEGTYEFVYPTVVGPRYNERPTLSSKQVQSKHITGSLTSPYDFDLQINLSTGVPIQQVASPTHKTKISYTGTSKATIQLSDKEATPGNRDFVLAYQLAGNQVASGLMLYEHEDENFFMLMMQPPKRVETATIPPREYVFIVDVSGSMSGFPLNTSKKLMRNLVTNLRPVDRFNVMLFAGTSGWLSEESLPAVPANIDKAVEFIDRQRGGGGTNLLSAMNKALSLPSCEVGLSRSFIIVTDGYISVEREVFDLIRNKAGEANLFSFGIGSGVNRHLIEGMASVGMSEPLVVMSPSSAAEKAEKFRQYINYPVLTNIKTQFKGLDVYDVEPPSLPDLLAERPLILYGKYRGKPAGSITIRGEAGDKKYKETFELSNVSPDPQHSALRYLWARKKIKLLDDYSNVFQGGDTQQEVTALGLKYNLMTAYTSFLAIENNQLTNQQSGDIQTVSSPQNNEYDAAVGFDLEVDDIEEDFSFHQEILVEGHLDVLEEEMVISMVAEHLISVLNTFLNENPITLKSIKFKIGANGKVTAIKIDSEQIGELVKEELLQLLSETNQIKNPSEGLLDITILF